MHRATSFMHRVAVRRALAITAGLILAVLVSDSIDDPAGAPELFLPLAWAIYTLLAAGLLRWLLPRPAERTREQLEEDVDELQAALAQIRVYAQADLDAEIEANGKPASNLYEIVGLADDALLGRERRDAR
jgi:hypothetical protein